MAVPNARPFGGAPSLLWSADGTALLSTDSADAGMGTWSMAPIDGSVERVGIAPLFWGGRPRYIDDAGRWIEPGTATVKSDGAAPEVWYDQQLAPARLREVSFTGDGRAAWLLLTGATAGTNGLELVRATSPSQRKVVVPLTPFDTLANADAAGLSWATPDDTTIVVSVFHKSTFDDIVLDLGRGTASALPTGVHVSGFVATTLADTLGGHTP